MKRSLALLLAVVMVLSGVLGGFTSNTYAESNVTAEKSENFRIAGIDRYATAKEIALSRYPKGAEKVIIVRGDQENGLPQVVDSLFASSLAGALDAPILLVNQRRTELPAATKEGIQKLNPEEVIILGGKNAVNHDLESALEDLSGKVTRVVHGKVENRFGTAAEVAKHVLDITSENTVIITRGANENLVDSLVAGPLAYGKGYPILLVNQQTIPEVTREFIKEMNVENVIVIGGEAIIDESILTELNTLVTGEVTRVAGIPGKTGGDRFGTSMEVAKKYFHDHDSATLVNGFSFVDAVAASILGNPILYVEKDRLMNEENRTERIGDLLGKKIGLMAIGGDQVISEEVLRLTKDFLKPDAVDEEEPGLDPDPSDPGPTDPGPSDPGPEDPGPEDPDTQRVLRVSSGGMIEGTLDNINNGELIPQTGTVVLEDGTEKQLNILQWERDNGDVVALETLPLGYHLLFGRMEGINRRVYLEVTVLPDGYVVEGEHAKVDNFEALQYAVEQDAISGIYLEKSMDFGEAEIRGATAFRIDKPLYIDFHHYGLVIDFKGAAIASIEVDGDDVTLVNGSINHLILGEEVESFTLKKITGGPASRFVFRGGGSNSVRLESSQLTGEVRMESEDPIRIYSEDDSKIQGDLWINSELAKIEVDTTTVIVDKKDAEVTVSSAEEVIFRKNGTFYGDPSTLKRTYNVDSIHVNPNQFKSMNLLLSNWESNGDATLIPGELILDFSLYRHALNRAEEFIGDAVPGAGEGQYSQEAIDILKDARENAKSEYETVKTAEVNQANQDRADEIGEVLMEATNQFRDSRIQVDRLGVWQRTFHVQRLVYNVNIGTAHGDYPESAYEELRNVLQKAYDQLNSGTLTYDEAEEMKTELEEARILFREQQIIDPEKDPVEDPDAQGVFQVRIENLPVLGTAPEDWYLASASYNFISPFDSPIQGVMEDGVYIISIPYYEVMVPGEISVHVAVAQEMAVGDLRYRFRIETDLETMKNSPYVIENEHDYSVLEVDYFGLPGLDGLRPRHIIAETTATKIGEEVEFYDLWFNHRYEMVQLIDGDYRVQTVIRPASFSPVQFVPYVITYDVKMAGNKAVDLGDQSAFPLHRLELEIPQGTKSYAIERLEATFADPWRYSVYVPVPLQEVEGKYPVYANEGLHEGLGVSKAILYNEDLWNLSVNLYNHDAPLDLSEDQTIQLTGEYRFKMHWDWIHFNRDLTQFNYAYWLLDDNNFRLTDYYVEEFDQWIYAYPLLTIVIDGEEFAVELDPEELEGRIFHDFIDERDLDGKTIEIRYEFTQDLPFTVENFSQDFLVEKLGEEYWLKSVEEAFEEGMIFVVEGLEYSDLQAIEKAEVKGPWGTYGTKRLIGETLYFALIEEYEGAVEGSFEAVFAVPSPDGSSTNYFTKWIDIEQFMNPGEVPVSIVLSGMDFAEVEFDVGGVPGVSGSNGGDSESFVMELFVNGGSMKQIYGRDEVLRFEKRSDFYNLGLLFENHAQNDQAPPSLWFFTIDSAEGDKTILLRDEDMESVFFDFSSWPGGVIFEELTIVHEFPSPDPYGEGQTGYLSIGFSEQQGTEIRLQKDQVFTMNIKAGMISGGEHYYGKMYLGEVTAEESTTVSVGGEFNVIPVHEFILRDDTTLEDFAWRFRYRNENDDELWSFYKVNLNDGSRDEVHPLFRIGIEDGDMVEIDVEPYEMYEKKVFDFIYQESLTEGTIVTIEVDQRQEVPFRMLPSTFTYEVSLEGDDYRFRDPEWEHGGGENGSEGGNGNGDHGDEGYSINESQGYVTISSAAGLKKFFEEDLWVDRIHFEKGMTLPDPIVGAEESIFVLSEELSGETFNFAGTHVGELQILGENLRIEHITYDTLVIGDQAKNLELYDVQGGEAMIFGGGSNSIYLEGDSNLGDDLYVSPVHEGVRIVSEDGKAIEGTVWVDGEHEVVIDAPLTMLVVTDPKSPIYLSSEIHTVLVRSDAMFILGEEQEQPYFQKRQGVTIQLKSMTETGELEIIDINGDKVQVILDVYAYDRMIARIEKNLNESVAGTGHGEYPQESIEKLQQVLAEGKEERDLVDSGITMENQRRIDEIVEDLERGFNEFRRSRIVYTKRALINVIYEVEALFQRVTIGDQHGQFPEHMEVELRDAVTEGRDVYFERHTTRSEIGTSLERIEEKLSDFLSSRIIIDGEEALIDVMVKNRITFEVKDFYYREMPYNVKLSTNLPLTIDDQYDVYRGSMWIYLDYFPSQAQGDMLPDHIEVLLGVPNPAGDRYFVKQLTVETDKTNHDVSFHHQNEHFVNLDMINTPEVGGTGNGVMSHTIFVPYHIEDDGHEETAYLRMPLYMEHLAVEPGDFILSSRYETTNDEDGFSPYVWFHEFDSVDFTPGEHITLDLEDELREVIIHIDNDHGSFDVEHVRVEYMRDRDIFQFISFGGHATNGERSFFIPAGNYHLRAEFTSGQEGEYWNTDIRIGEVSILQDTGEYRITIPEDFSFAVDFDQIGNPDDSIMEIFGEVINSEGMHLMELEKLVTVEYHDEEDGYEAIHQQRVYPKIAVKLHGEDELLGERTLNWENDIELRAWLIELLDDGEELDGKIFKIILNYEDRIPLNIQTKEGTISF